MAGSVIKTSKNQVDELLTTPGKTVLPATTLQMEAQDEANQMNNINQLVIGAKEGIIKAITKLVGSNVTNAILQTADGSNHESIDEFMLFGMMKVAINGADRPSTHDVLEQLLKVINHPFEFCKKVSVNTELMQSNVAQMATYGILIGILQITVTMVANIKSATKSNYSRKFCLAMHIICKTNMPTITCMMQCCSNVFDQGAGPQGWNCTKRRGHIPLPTLFHTST